MDKTNSLFTSIPICIFLYFILWLWVIAIQVTLPKPFYFLLLMPFIVWADKISQNILDKNFNYNSFNLNLTKGLKINISKSITTWIIWLSLLILVLYFFNLFHDNIVFHIIFLFLIIRSIKFYFEEKRESKYLSIFNLTILNILGVLFHSSYYLGIGSESNKDLYFAYSETDNFEKMNYHLQKCIDDPSTYQFTFEEIEDIINSNQNYNGNKIYKSEIKYPLEYKSFNYTNHDRLVNKLVYSFFNKTEEYYLFTEWLNYLIRYGHYDKAFEFSKAFENILMDKLYEFNDWEEYFELLKKGVLSSDKLFPENKHKSNKWVRAFIKVKKYQYHYYQYINDEELMSQTLSEYYKIDMYKKDN